jgi:hypothetical protein
MRRKKMDETVDSAETIPVYLRTSLVEAILLACIKGVSFSCINNSVQKIEYVSEGVIRKYLFYLINGNFIQYNGRRKIFILCHCGAELLHLIYTQMQHTHLHYQDLTIKVE